MSIMINRAAKAVYVLTFGGAFVLAIICGILFAACTNNKEKPYCEQAIACLDRAVLEENQGNASEYRNNTVIMTRCTTKTVIAEIESDIIIEVKGECVLYKTGILLNVIFDITENTCALQVLDAKIKSRNRC